MVFRAPLVVFGTASLILTVGLTVPAVAAPPLAAAVPATATPAIPDDPSVRENPAEVVAGVVPGEAARVSVTSLTPERGLEVATVPVVGPSQAGAVVAAAQKRPGTVAVGLVGKVSALVAPGLVTPSVTVPTVPNDPMRPQQWALDALSAETAWELATGTGATVAVVDTGVQGNHPDLRGHVVAGADYVTKWPANAPTTITCDDYLTPVPANADSDPLGPYYQGGHGTHVAGAIAAVTNNRVGISSLAREAKIMPIRTLTPSGDGTTAAVACGVVKAADLGADVINLSLGGPEDDPALRVAVQYAVGKGAVVVAAGGNSKQDDNAPSYPAAYPEVIAVAATDANDQIAPFSTTGAYIDVAAPGVDVLSTFNNNSYERLNGTSMAAPFVSAAAALLKGNARSRTPAQIQSLLEKTADDLGPSGKDPQFGAGLINPTRALQQVVAHSTATGDQFVPITPARVYDSRSAQPTPGKLANNASRVVHVADARSASTGAVLSRDIVPPGATAVAYNLTATETDAKGYLAVTPGNVGSFSSSAINWAAARTTIANGLVAKVDGQRNLRVFDRSSGAGSHFVVDILGYYVPPRPAPPAGSAFVAVTPTRVYDSRSAIPAPGVLRGGQSRVVGVADGRSLTSGAVTVANLVPAGATAVAYNLTVTDTRNPGFLAVTPGDARGYSSSAINWTSQGTTIANGLVAKVDASRRVKVFAGGASPQTHIMIDVLGYFVPAASRPPAATTGFVPVTPVRVYDSRLSYPTPGPVPAGGSRLISVADGRATATGAMSVPGVVPVGATAVAYNLTVTGPDGRGFLAVAPGNATGYSASAINWTRSGMTIANGLVAKMDSQRQIRVFARGASTHVVVDVVGYYVPGK